MIKRFVVNKPEVTMYFYQPTPTCPYWTYSYEPGATTASPDEDVAFEQINKILGWLNHYPPIPGVQAWLKSEYNQSMTLEEFLEATK